jgi:purine-cytosine permease-like protein
MSNPVTGVQSLIPEWMFIIFGIAAVGGAVANNVMTFYASGLVVQSLGIPIRRYRATMIDTAVATCLVIYIVFISTSFTNDINDVLALMIVWIAPFAGVWLVDGTMRGWSYDTRALHATRVPSGKYWGWKGINRTGFIAMAAGMVVCALTIDSTVYQGPISRALDGADLSWLLGLPVSGLVYYVLARRSLRTGNSPTAAPEHDATPVTARY